MRHDGDTRDRPGLLRGPFMSWKKLITFAASLVFAQGAAVVLVKDVAVELISEGVATEIEHRAAHPKAD